jgi:hypothetical protein
MPGLAFVILPQKRDILNLDKRMDGLFYRLINGIRFPPFPETLPLSRAKRKHFRAFKLVAALFN